MTPARTVSLRLAGLVTVIVLALGAIVLALSPASSSPEAESRSWNDIVVAARGQTVHLWMWGGEVALNRYVDEEVVPRAARAGVNLQRVPIDDTAAALARISAERDAGRTSGGAVDLLWVNGKNFAQGRDADLWLTGWASRLPGAALLDPGDPTLQYDFGVAVDGDELPWSRAAFVFAHDPTRVPSPPRSFTELATFVRANPGRFTYPAPPDFTGSAFVRQAVQALGQEEAFRLLAEMQPLLWERGRAYPKDQPELERLFADGQVDLVMSYNPSFVETGVERGAFPASTRPFVFEGGTLQNVSFLAIPANASSSEGAQVVADLMLGAELQALKLGRVGIPTVLDIDRLGPEAAAFDLPASPYRLDRFGTPLEELPADDVPALDRRWRAEVLR